MNFWQRFLRWRLARQHQQLSRAWTLRHARTKRLETYVVCLDCGVELEYDLASMRLTGRVMQRPVQSPDVVAIERAWQDEPTIKVDPRSPDEIIEQRLLFTRTRGRFGKWIVILAAAALFAPSISRADQCDDARAKAAPVIRRLTKAAGFSGDWRWKIVCDRTAWEADKRHFDLRNTDSAFTNIDTRTTYIFAPRLDEAGWQDLIAHEIGHRVCMCPDESRAEKEAAALWRKLKLEEVAQQ